MDICLIFDNPETPQHPVIRAALQRLSARHTMRMLDIRTLTAEQARVQESTLPLADLYLLKSHAPQSLDLAHWLEGRGALVVNSWAASLACQDRAMMSERMLGAGLPWPRTWHFATLAELLRWPDLRATVPFPLILKSAYSHRGDLVQKIGTVAELEGLAGAWSAEPVIVQEFVPGDGWDTKLWVIDQYIFAARRRTTLEAEGKTGDIPLALEELPAAWITLTREVGRVFDLRLYGLDLLLTARGPMVVDVNGFPGFRGAPGAVEALVGLVERLGQERGLVR